MCNAYRNPRPFFSVIIPVYQCENTISACLESVLSQQEAYVELVLIVDGATDQSGKICDSYRERYPEQITVLHKENEGPLIARLDGIRVASGQYVMFLDADDKFLPGIFSQMKETLQSTQADMVIFNHVRVMTNATRSINAPLYADGQMFEGAGLSKLIEDAVITSNLNPLWQKCARRELLQEADIFRKYGRLIIGEDKLLSLHVMSRSKKAVYLADGLYEYYLSPNSLSHRLELKHYQNMAIVFSEVRTLSCKLGIKECDDLYYRNLVEFGMSCLYSTARRVLMQLETIHAFQELFSYIKADDAFWKAYDSYRNHMAIHKRFACLFLQRGWMGALFQYFRCFIQAKEGNLLSR